MSSLVARGCKIKKNIPDYGKLGARLEKTNKKKNETVECKKER